MCITWGRTQETTCVSKVRKSKTIKEILSSTLGEENLHVV